MATHPPERCTWVWKQLGAVKGQMRHNRHSSSGIASVARLEGQTRHRRQSSVYSCHLLSSLILYVRIPDLCYALQAESIEDMSRQEHVWSWVLSMVERESSCFTRMGRCTEMWGCLFSRAIEGCINSQVLWYLLIVLIRKGNCRTVWRSKDLLLSTKVL